MHEQHRYSEHVATYNSCADACEHCAAECLMEKNAEHYRCIQLCLDCADLCRLTATLMLRGSEYATASSHLCRVACLACADECAAHESDHCQQCARACQACADAAAS